MKLLLPTIAMLQRIFLEWIGVVFAFSAVTVTAVLLVFLVIRLSPVLRGNDPPSSTIITAVPQQLQLSEYTIIQDLHEKKIKQRTLLEGVTARPFDPLDSP